MRLSSTWLILLGVALVACKEGDPSSLDTFNTAPVTGTGTDTDPDNEESTDTDESSTETGEPEPYEGTRYIVLADDGARLIGINLDDPTSIPDPSTLIS